MERLDQTILDRAIQVDQEIPAGDQIEMRERRIANHVVTGEQHALAQLAADAVEAPTFLFVKSSTRSVESLLPDPNSIRQKPVGK